MRIVALPDGEDPDSLIIKFGIDEFKKLIDEALPALNYLIKEVKKNEDQKTVVGRKRLRNEIMNFINKCPSESWKEEMIIEASRIINISARSLTKDIEDIKDKKVSEKSNQDLHFVNQDGSYIL